MQYSVYKTPDKQFPNTLHWRCHRRTPPDVEDLFSAKVEPFDDTRPDCEDIGTFPGLSDANRSPTIQQQ